MKDYPQNSMANENSILKDISIVGQEASLLWEGAFCFCREFCYVFIFATSSKFYQSQLLGHMKILGRGTKMQRKEKTCGGPFFSFGCVFCEWSDRGNALKIQFSLCISLIYAKSK